MKKAHECMNDVVKNAQEELIEVNLGDEEKGEKMMKISKNLSEKKKGKLVALLKEYKDVFAWSYQEMLGLSPNLVTAQVKSGS